MKYCPKCGNTGTLVDGTPCTCRVDDSPFFDELSGIDVPAPYQGLRFNAGQVPNDLSPAYAGQLDQLHTQITTMQLQNKNYCICSPAQHSKTVWAYSCIQNLFRQRLPILPLQEVMELRRVMNSFSEPVDLYTNPYLFVRIPGEVTDVTRATIATILERRVRRSNSTFFIYNGSWRRLTKGDYDGTLRDLQGDGSFASLKVLNFERPKQGEQ